ncbi:MFS general substrate transporter [Meira miltonrushii]|uniref:MFS general substrate transporter n=1 Tax=Meira miltonrushii TaxID=1280837 RepID=A0A316VLS8_9BASI|nr:MFS general substrate transporter [Meira miltonrushii]PWN38477.1 MFS general substrate transporter [Meira miltonrushii]
MVLKQTSIHANFFPHGERYSTTDVNANEQSANTPAVGTTPSHSRKTSLKNKEKFETKPGQEQPQKKSFLQKIGLQKAAADPIDLQLSAHDKDNIILVDWDGEDDPTNPMNWSLRKKNLTTGMLCMMCLFIGLATAGYSSGITQMCQELGCSNEIGQVGLFLFNAAFSIVPLFLGPLSEFVGAQPVYLICYAGFVIFFIPLALAKNIGTVLVSRFLLGCFGAAGTTIIPGTLASIWKTEERGNKVALFSLVAVLGTVGAPLYNGFIAQQKGWRWIEWVQLIVNGAVLVIELIFLRETRGSVLLTRKARKLRKQTGDMRFRAAAELETPSIKALLHASTTRAAVLLVREPVVLFFSLWLAYEWALIFALFAGIPLVFQGLHGWGEGVGGLAYIAPILGTFAAWIVNFHATTLYNRARERNGGVPVPEARLYYATVGALTSTAGMFIFAFTSYRHVHWIGPEVGLFLLIAGVFFVFDAVQNYLSDFYGSEYASSAISAQGFVRNMMAASFPLFTTQMFNNLTIPYAGLLLACLLALACPLPFIFIRYGERIRASSRYAVSDEAAVKATEEKIEAGQSKDLANKQKGDIERGQGPVIGARRSRKAASRTNSVNAVPSVHQEKEVVESEVVKQ